MGRRIIITQGKKNMDHGKVGHTDFQTKGRKRAETNFVSRGGREGEGIHGPWSQSSKKI